MRTVVIDFSRFGNAKEAHAYLKDTLSFPEYYGANLDALYDCLTDMTGGIRLYHAAEMRRSLLTYGEKILRVLKDAQSDALKVEFVD